MKRKIALFFLALTLVHAAHAGIYVYQLTGKGYLQQDGEWIELYKTQQLTETDIVRTADYSSLTLIDDSRQKLFSLQSQEPVCIKDIVSRKEHSVSLLKETFHGILQAMRTDNQKSVAHYQKRGGVTYRGQDEDRAVAMALTEKCSSDLPSLRSNQSNYPVSLRLIDLYGKQPVTTAPVGSNLIAEVENRSNMVLYVNLLDIDSEGNRTILFPMDEQASMLHLVVPAYSTIRFTDFPFTLYEPLGTDHMLLVAYPQPFNMQNVLDLMPLTGTGNEKIGFSIVPLLITNK